MKTSIILILLTPLIYANSYLSNKDCSECHEKIYEEYKSSSHSKSYFNDELHKKVADSVSKEKYKCAVCHMPMADNLQDLVNGKARPDINNKTHTDAVSCYFCHTIAYVKKAHRHNINIKAKQAQGYKPTLYGRLKNPEDSNKHSSVNNPIYAKGVCIGCHSHKLNENNITIFRTIDANQDSIDCIRCHMPKVEGGVEKMNKRSRTEYKSHKFLGIYDREFRKEGLDINITNSNNEIIINLTNKMGHPLIIQPARAKYLKVKVIRDNKTIWQNYDNNPEEDSKILFELKFKRNSKYITIPATATKVIENNIDKNETKTINIKILS